MMMIWFKESLSSTCAGVCCSETQGANSTLSRTDIDLHQRLLYDDDGDDDDGGGGDDDGGGGDDDHNHNVLSPG